jgi:hypothetical protein
MFTMNLPKAKASKFHVLDDPNEIVELFNSQSDQVLKKQKLAFDGLKILTMPLGSFRLSG